MKVSFHICIKFVVSTYCKAVIVTRYSLVLGSAENNVRAVSATDVLLPLALDAYSTSMYDELELSLSARKIGISVTVMFVINCSADML